MRQRAAFPARPPRFLCTSLFVSFARTSASRPECSASRQRQREDLGGHEGDGLGHAIGPNRRAVLGGRILCAAHVELLRERLGEASAASCFWGARRVGRDQKTRASRSPPVHQSRVHASSAAERSARAGSLVRTRTRRCTPGGAGRAPSANWCVWLGSVSDRGTGPERMPTKICRRHHLRKTARRLIVEAARNLHRRPSGHSAASLASVSTRSNQQSSG